MPCSQGFKTEEAVALLAVQLLISIRLSSSYSDTGPINTEISEACALPSRAYLSSSSPLPIGFTCRPWRWSYYKCNLVLRYPFTFPKRVIAWPLVAIVAQNVHPDSTYVRTRPLWKLGYLPTLGCLDTFGFSTLLVF